MNNRPINNAAPSRPEFRQCFGCNYEAVTSDPFCPRCRTSKFFTADSIRMRGIIGLLVGAFLVIFMGAIGVFAGIMLLGASNDPSSAKRIKNEFATLIAIYAVFAAVIAFGVNSFLSGAWMVIAGRRNRFLVWVMWALLAAILIGGGMLRIFIE